MSRPTQEGMAIVLTSAVPEEVFRRARPKAGLTALLGR